MAGEKIHIHLSIMGPLWVHPSQMKDIVASHAMLPILKSFSTLTLLVSFVDLIVGEGCATVCDSPCTNSSCVTPPQGCFILCGEAELASGVNGWIGIADSLEALTFFTAFAQIEEPGVILGVKFGVGIPLPEPGVRPLYRGEKDMPPCVRPTELLWKADREVRTGVGPPVTWGVSYTKLSVS